MPIDCRNIPYSRDIFGEMEDALAYLRGERDKYVVDGRITDFNAYKRYDAEMERLALGGFNLGRKYKDDVATDDLTGLLSPKYIRRVLQDIAARRKRETGIFSVIVADIDFFKRINDEHGHDKGDIVLHTLGYALREILRNGDELGRCGGEEFLTIVPDGLDGAKEVAKKVRNTVNNLEIRFPGNEIIKITLCQGIACSDDVGYSSIELFSCADEALYESKHNGRNAINAWRGRELFETVI